MIFIFFCRLGVFLFCSLGSFPKLVIFCAPGRCRLMLLLIFRFHRFAEKTAQNFFGVQSIQAGIQAAACFF